MGRVGIIDDSEDALELFQHLLEGDHEFIGFSDAIAFVTQFQNGQFDLILLDLVMPGMDGFEVFKRIRMRDGDVPVVAITAAAHPEEREAALAAGFCDYFVKPIVEIERFRAKVYSHIGQCSDPPHPKALRRQ